MSLEFEQIKQFISTRRVQGLHGYADFTIGEYLRKYTKAQLRQAEILRLKIDAHFEPSGEECGTIYETVCKTCNLGRQTSDLILDVRRVPQHKDISESIAWVEWIVSLTFARTFAENELTGAEFKPIFDFKNPTKHLRHGVNCLSRATRGNCPMPQDLGKTHSAQPKSVGGVRWDTRL